MANKKISELTSASLPLDENVILPIVQDGETKKVTASNLVGNFAQEKLDGYNETGTRAGGDLVVTIGDYDSSDNGSVLELDAANKTVSIKSDNQLNKVELSPNSLSFRFDNGYTAMSLEPLNTASTITRNLRLPDSSGTLATEEYVGVVADGLSDAINNAIFGELVTYQTLADFNAVSPVPADGTPFVVANDPNEDNNGYWSVVSGSPVQNSKTVENIVEETNTSKGVTGKAVNDFVDEKIPEKLSFYFKRNTNYANKNDVQAGFTINGTTGELTPNGSYVTTNFIPVNPNTYFSVAGVARRAFYDINQVFISSVASGSAFTTPNTCYYVKLVTLNANLDILQMNNSATLLPYEVGSGYYLTEDLVVKGEKITDKSIVAQDKLEDNTLDKYKLNFIEESNQLLNPNSISPNTTIDQTTGAEVESFNNSTSEFIQIKPNTDYSFSGSCRKTFYLKDKTFRNSFSNSATTFTSYSDAYWMRISADENNFPNLMVNEGSSVLPFENYYRRLVDFTEPIDKSDFARRNTFVKPLVNSEIYTAPIMPDASVGTAGDWHNLSPNDIYNLYDDLVALYPDYITKEYMGLSAGGEEINKYELKPKVAYSDISTQPDVKFKKLMWIAGSHGYEKASVIVTYYTIKQLCENWNDTDALTLLRWNLHFIVFPLQNPDGWITDDRKNANGVDLARNFPYRWVYNPDVNSATYGGEFPLSESENVYVNNVLEANKEDIIYTLDFHNFNVPTSVNLTWLTCATFVATQLANTHILKLTTKWKNDNPIFPQDDTTILGYTDLNAPLGSFGVQGGASNIDGGTFEVNASCPYEAVPVENNQLAIKLGMESFVNFLMLIFRNKV